VSLVLVLHQGEELKVGDAVLRMEVRADGKIRVFIDAPRSVDVLRQSAKKRVAA
jgi:sRNA-binding carbon storage regulator CsrA